MSLVVLAAQSCPTLCGPMDCTPPGSSVLEFSRQQYWSGLPCPPPRDRPNPGTKPTSLMSAALADRFFTTKFTREAQYIWCTEYDIILKDEKEMILCGFCFLVRALSLTHPGFPFPCPIFAAFFLKATTSVLCGFLASMEPKGQGGRLANGTELTSNITQRLSWKIGFFRLFHLWTPFSLLGYTVPLLSSLKRYLPFPSH